MSYAIITGASSGIGKALARKFAENGVNLVITSIDLKILNEMKNELGKEFDINVVCIYADLSKHEDVLKLIKESDKLDIEYLVNNAGVGSFEVMWDASKEWDQKLIQINISALTFLMQHYLERFIKKNKGTIINMSSRGGSFLFPGSAVYASTKWYISTLSMQTHMELRRIKSNVSVKCVEPGPVSTNFFSSSATKVDKKKVLEGFTKISDPELVVSPDDIAQFTLDLMKSDKSMGRIIGSERKMWNPDTSSKTTLDHTLGVVLDAYKK